MHKLSPIRALNDNYIWAIMHPNKSDLVIVDPGEAAPALEFIQANGCVLRSILITHHHWDHTNGIQEILEQYPVPVYGPADDNVPELSHPVREGNSINLKEIEMKLQVLDIPGHTSGHIALYGNGIVFTGDTLFTAGCGKIFEGTSEQMYNSLQKLAALPDVTLVYCGHEYTQDNLKFAKLVELNNPDIDKRIEEVNKLRAENLPTVPSTIALEKLTNPFLRIDIPEVISQVEAWSGKSISAPTEILGALRAWKNSI